MLSSHITAEIHLVAQPVGPGKGGRHHRWRENLRELLTTRNRLTSFGIYNEDQTFRMGGVRESQSESSTRDEANCKYKQNTKAFQAKSFDEYDRSY